jgi:2-polyprenyl-6-methoxyphenol hydroxylase-like FAD-dependent oxidoreductase
MRLLKGQFSRAYCLHELTICCRHGHRFLLLERRQFIQALLDCLPTKDPIRTRAAVKDIAESENGVRVYLNDGSYEDGDIVVGCDGVASRVRQIMWNHANQAVPNTITPKEMQCT